VCSTSTTHRAGQDLRRYDEAALKELAAERGDMKDHIARVREKIEEQEQLLRKDLHHPHPTAIMRGTAKRCGPQRARSVEEPAVEVTCSRRA
jgi:hypothetical protein